MCPLLMQWTLERRNTIILVDSVQRTYRELVVPLHAAIQGLSVSLTRAPQLVRDTAEDVGFLCGNTVVRSRTEQTPLLLVVKGTSRKKKFSTLGTKIGLNARTIKVNGTWNSTVVTVSC